MMMRSFVVAVACSFLLLTPGVGQAQRKKKEGPAPGLGTATAEEYAQLNQQKDVTGKLIQLDPIETKDKKSITFRYEYFTTEANPKYKPTKVAKPHDFTKEVQKLDQEQLKAMNLTNLAKQQAALQQIALKRQQLLQRYQQEQINYAAREKEAQQRDAQSGNVPFVKVTKSLDFTVQLEDKLVVRRKKPAMEYDDKGFIKEYSKEQLDKLHLVDNKDKKKPGYPSKYEELATSQVVQVFLTPGKREKADPAKGDSKSANPDSMPPIPTVHTIMIVEDIPNPNNVPKK